MLSKILSSLFERLWLRQIRPLNLYCIEAIAAEMSLTMRKLRGLIKDLVMLGNNLGGCTILVEVSIDYTLFIPY